MTKLNLIYEWDQKSIDDQNNAIIKKTHPKELYDSSTKHLDLIWESTYFDDIDEMFEDWFVKKFDEFREECIKKAEQNKEYDMELQMKVSEIARHLPLHKLKDYKNFHQFIRLLTNSTRHLDCFNYR